MSKFAKDLLKKNYSPICDLNFLKKVLHATAFKNEQRVIILSE